MASNKQLVITAHDRELSKYEIPSTGHRYGSIEVKDNGSVWCGDNHGTITNNHYHQEIEQEIQRIADWYSPADFAAQQTDLLSQREDGTAEWLFSDLKFQEWQRSKHSVLLCTGIPGSGKSVLAASIIDYLQRQHARETDVAVVYFYCNYKRQQDQTPARILSALIRQLFQERSPVPDEVQQLYELYHKRKTRPSLAELSVVLHTLVTSYRKVTMVIDALDEYSNDEYQRDKFLDQLLKLQTLASQNTNILVTSRAIPEVTERFVDNIHIEVSASTEDIEVYLSQRIKEICRSRAFLKKDQELQEQVKQHIVKAAGGMFLIARLQIESLRRKTSRGELKVALEVLGQRPTTLHNIYHETMLRIQLQEYNCAQLALKVLLWTTQAKRELSVGELQEAIAIRPADLMLNIQDYLVDLDLIISVCYGLVEHNHQADKVRLVHYTAQEYFQDDQPRLRWFPDANSSIASTCMAAMSMELLVLRKEGPDEEYLWLRHPRHELIDYARTFWSYHAGTVTDQDTQDRIIVFLSDSGFLHSITRARAVKRRDLLVESPYPTQLSHAIVDLPDEGTETSPLHFAIANNIDWLVSRIITAGRDTGRQASVQGTALVLAIVCHATTAIKLLLEHGGIDINATDFKAQTALIKAAMYDNVEIVRLLLRNLNLQVNARDKNGRTALSWAAEYDNAEVVRHLLRETEIQVNACDNKGLTSVHWAARASANAALKELLADSRTAVDIEDSCGESPLHHAAWSNSVDQVRQLLDHGPIDVNCRTKQGSTPLILAAMGGTCEVSKCLLDHPRTDISLVDLSGRSALIQAVWYNCHGIVEQLLAQPGIQVNLLALDGKAAIHVAVARGYTEILAFLLAHPDVDVNLKRSDGNSALHIAVSSGRLDCVVLLLAHRDINVNMRSSNGRTALEMALDEYWFDIAEQLIAHPGTGFGAGDERLPTLLVNALWQTFKNERHNLLTEPCAELDSLLVSKVYIGTTERRVLTFISQLLVHPRIDINAKDADGFTALTTAARYKYVCIVKRILAHPRIASFAELRKDPHWHYVEELNERTNLGLDEAFVQNDSLALRTMKT